MLDSMPANAPDFQYETDIKEMVGLILELAR